LRLLLDTHVVLWQLLDARPLGERTQHAVVIADDMAMSVVSFAEVGIMAATGKMRVPGDFEAEVLDMGVRVLALTAEHGLGVGELPLHHRDPFDRLLVAQARHEGMTIVTADPAIRAYDVAVLDPRT
jgi:PIN domain nuclease of toxin-antitoxin system